MQPDTLAVFQPDSAAARPGARSAAAPDTVAADTAEAPAEALPLSLDTSSVAEALRDLRAALPDTLPDVRQAADVASGGLWTRTVDAAEQATGVGRTLTEDLLLTGLVVVLLWATRAVVLLAVRRHTDGSGNVGSDDPRTLYRWRKGTLYAAVAIGIAVLLPMWVGAFDSVATFFGLLTAGLAIALRDPIVNVFGWFYILWRRPFVPGDRITVREHTGDVTDQRLFGFTLLEVATETGAFQSTGRVVFVPNGWVFAESFVNHTGAFAYIWNEVAVTVTFESGWRGLKADLAAVGERHGATFSADAERALRRAASEHFIFFSALTPVVYTSVVQDGVRLTLRYLVAPRLKRVSEEAVWEDVLDAVAARGDVAFAHTTQRVYRATEEGPPGLRPPVAGRPAASPDAGAPDV